MLIITEIFKYIHSLWYALYIYYILKTEIPYKTLTENNVRYIIYFLKIRIFI